MKNLNTPVVFSLKESSPIVDEILLNFEFEKGGLLLHDFPDGESYVKINTEVKDREVIIIENLNNPNAKILSLLLFIETAKDLGAKKIGLISPYLAYMRQDIRFKEGEGITSRYFASILSLHLDWLMTMDPHLHRYKNLNEIYSIPTYTLHATKNIREWIANNVSDPVIIGPDMESEQWVEAIAHKIKAPYLILEKKRIDDKKVEINIPDIYLYQGHTPVLIDDIISTGKTMAAAAKVLQDLNTPPVVCIGVHSIFSDNAYEELRQIPGIQIVTCNTIKHITNQIDVSNQFIQQLQMLNFR